MPALLDPSLFLIWGLVIVLFVVALRRRDGSAAQGVRRGVEMFLVNGPRVMVALLSAGFLAYILPKDVVAQWLGHGAGWRAILIGCAVGPFFPGGPLVIFPVVVALLKAGAGLPAVIAFLTAASVWGVQRIIVFEIPMMGSWFAATRLAATLILPPLAGFISAVLIGLTGSPTLH